MNDSDTKTTGHATKHHWWAPVLWVLSSFLFFILLFFDPFSWHPLDEWLQARLGLERQPAMGQAASSERQVLFYRNPMDPTITSPVPAKDEMGMDYIPVYTDEALERSSEKKPHGRILFYRNPMDPTITSPVPAQDEMGMDYVPVYEDDTAATVGEGVTVTIDPAVVQNMNVQTAAVVRQNLQHDVRTVGSLEYDQERMVTVTTRYSGWVEKVYVNYVGEPVKKGQALFEVYSPELVQTEQELLSAIQYARNLADAPPDSRRRAEALVEAARTRLSYWDVSAEQVAELERTGKVFRTLQVVAPSGGLVMRRMAGLEGMAVRPGMEAYHIADLSALWLSVEVFEDQISWIKVGTPARVTFTYFPGETFRGTVRFIEPELQAATRTLRVKIAVPNPGGRLRAGMFATVVFEPLAVSQALTVPSLAVLRTGQRDVVIVDLGGGRFEPRTVELGHEGEGLSEVLTGLKEGERVVTSSQFLLDSEASLQEAIQKMISGSTEIMAEEEAMGAESAGEGMTTHQGVSESGTPPPPSTSADHQGHAEGAAALAHQHGGSDDAQ